MEQEKANEYIFNIINQKIVWNTSLFQEAIQSCNVNQVFSAKEIINKMYKTPIFYLLDIIPKYSIFDQNFKREQFYELLKKSDLNQQEYKDGMTPLMFIVKYNFKNKYCLTREQIYPLLKQSNLNLQNFSGRTILSYLFGNNIKEELNLSRQDITDLLQKYQWNTSNHHDEKIIFSLLQYNNKEIFVLKKELKKILKNYHFNNKTNFWSEFLYKKFQLDVEKSLFFLIKDCHFKFNEEDYDILLQLKQNNVLDFIKKIEIKQTYESLNKNIPINNIKKNQLKI